jgi:catechol 2,3-dioxygenase-like lactoylglutathione lyase family enzyme
MPSRPIIVDAPNDQGATAWRVEDFEAARSALEGRGVSFRGETLDSGVCYQAFFQDPDGNMLAIHHRYAPAAPSATASEPA